MATNKITLNELKNLIRKVINEDFDDEQDSNWDYDWYKSLKGWEKLESGKYPKSFVDWILENDTWAYNYTLKYGFKSLMELFRFYVKEFGTENKNTHVEHRYQKWYANAMSNGAQDVEVYPEEFVAWLDTPVAKNITYKRKINKLIDLFEIWFNAK